MFLCDSYVVQKFRERHYRLFLPLNNEKTFSFFRLPRSSSLRYLAREKQLKIISLHPQKWEKRSPTASGFDTSKLNIATRFAIANESKNPRDMALSQKMRVRGGGNKSLLVMPLALLLTAGSLRA